MNDNSNENLGMISDSDSSENSSDSNHNLSTATTTSGSSSSSSSSSGDENTDDSGGEPEEQFEPVRILKQKFELPKGLCEDKAFFNEFFSLDTWDSLPQHIQTHLKGFLPKFPENDEQEKEITIERLFNQEPFRFDTTPMQEFQRNLEEGNYRPDIVKLRASIAKSQRREYRFQECERISRLAKAMMISRSKLLRAAYDGPPGAVLKVDRYINALPKFTSSPAALRAKKRYFQEISSMSAETGIPKVMSDDENYPEGPPAQLSRKQKRHLSGIQGGTTSPSAEPRIISTLACRGKSLDHLVGPGGTTPLSEEFYKQMLLHHKRRKLDEPEHPDLETFDINLKDVYSRTQISSGPRRLLPHSKIINNNNSNSNNNTNSNTNCKKSSSTKINHLDSQNLQMSTSPTPEISNISPILLNSNNTISNNQLQQLNQSMLLQQEQQNQPQVHIIPPQQQQHQHHQQQQLPSLLMFGGKSHTQNSFNSNSDIDSDDEHSLSHIKVEEQQQQSPIKQELVYVQPNKPKIKIDNTKQVQSGKKRVASTVTNSGLGIIHNSNNNNNNNNSNNNIKSNNNNNNSKSTNKKLTNSFTNALSVLNTSTQTVIHAKDENITIVHNSVIPETQTAIINHNNNINAIPTTNNNNNIRLAPTINITNYGKIKPATLSDLEGIDMMHLPVDLDDSGHIDILSEVNDNDKTPELMQETHACYLSLIRDVFCSTPDHRMPLGNLQSKITGWLANPITPLNDWYNLADNWFNLLSSAINFMAGEFADQPEDFVPYLEYKPHLQIYQWIGAGRDTDQHLIPLCNYWLSRRHEMGTKPVDKHQTDTTRNRNFSYNETEDNQPPERPASPPPPRCPTSWVVQKATLEEIDDFREQERRRFENPHLSFTYHLHGYDSVVGPVKGIYTQIPGISKARGHNMLTADRPSFVTILTLVRDATARLPNGEGTRADICELLKSSQYINNEAPENVLQTIVSGALDRMHTELDPCVRYDSKRKIWIYLHRNRSEEEFERLHQQYQGLGKHKKTGNRKVKQKLFVKSSAPAKITATPPIVPIINKSNNNIIPNTTSTPAALSPIIQKLQPQVQQQQLQQVQLQHQTPQQLPALSTIQQNNQMMNSSPPPLINKILSPKQTIMKAELVPIQQHHHQVQQQQQQQIIIEAPFEHIDVESSIEAHTTVLVKNQNVPSLIVDQKQHQQQQQQQIVKTINKLNSTMNQHNSKGVSLITQSTPVKVSTSCGVQTVHVSMASASQLSTGKPLTSILANTNQSVLVNQNRSQSPIVIGKKQLTTKPLIISQTQAPPLIQQSSPSGQGYIIPINLGPNGDQINRVITSLSSNLVPGNATISPKLIKTNVPALTTTLSPKISLLNQQSQQALQQKTTTVRVSTSTPQPGKSLINPVIAASNISIQQQQQQQQQQVQVVQQQQQQQQQKIIVATSGGLTTGPGTTTVKLQQRPTNVSVVNNIITTTGKPGQQTTLTAAQHKQLIQNFLAQQQLQQKQRQNAVTLGQATLQQQPTQHQQVKSIIVQQQSGGGGTTIIGSHNQQQQLQKLVSAMQVSGALTSNTTTPTLTTIPRNSLINSQIIQIQQSGHPQQLQQHQQGTKIQTLNLTPQQQQNLQQSIKQQQLKLQAQQQSGVRSLLIKQVQDVDDGQKQQQQQQTVVVSSPATPKAGTSLLTNVVSSGNINSTIQTFSTANSTVCQNATTVARIIKPGTSLVQQQNLTNLQNSTGGVQKTTGQQGPLMAKVFTNTYISLESLLQKQGLAPGATLRVAGAKPGQTSLIQLAGTPGSQTAQYAVVSQNRNIISMNAPRLITTQASTSSVNATTLSNIIKTSTAGKSPVITTTIAGQQSNVLVASSQHQHININQQGQQQHITTQAKIISQPQSITAQQLMNAKLVGVQGIAGGKMKPGSGIRMVNASNLNIAHIGGKPVIIASKATPGQPGGQSIVLQGTPNANGGTNLVIGGQTLKVQGNVINQTNASGQQTQTVMIGNQAVKVHTQGILQQHHHHQQHQQQQQNLVHSNTINSVGNTVTVVSSGGNSVSSGNIITTSLSNNNNNNNGNIITTSASNMGKTVILGSTGQTIKVQSPMHQQTAGNIIVSGGQTSQQQQQQQQVVVGTAIKGNTKTIGTASPGQQRVFLAVQGRGPLVLPSGFQGSAINLKALQGLKVIPIQQQQQQQQQQQNKGEERQVIAQIINQRQQQQLQQAAVAVRPNTNNNNNNNSNNTNNSNNNNNNTSGES